MRERLLSILDYRYFSRQPPGVREAFRVLRREMEMEREYEKTRQRLRALDGEIRLNLGCGADVMPGWVNISTDGGGSESRPDFYKFDLRRGIPLPEESVSFIYSSHFFEHLTNGEGQGLMRESYRVLTPGGIFRMALPTTHKLFDYYLRDDRSYWHMLPIKEMFGREDICYGDLADEAIYQHGEHVCFYDPERAVRVLTEIGFREAREPEYLEGVDLSDELRRFGSFYVEGRK